MSGLSRLTNMKAKLAFGFHKFLSSGENQPTVECSRPLFATSTWLDAEIGGRPFNHITQPNVFIANKSGQPDFVGLVTVWFVHIVLGFADVGHGFTGLNG